MSISMLIEYKQQEAVEKRMIPVCTQGIFNDEWEPLSRRLGLYRVSVLNYGSIRFDREAVQELLQEMEQLWTALAQQEKTSYTAVRTAARFIENLKYVEEHYEEIASIHI